MPDSWRSTKGFTWVVAYSAAVILAGYTIHLLFESAAPAGDYDEDRPPIIVRDGSAIFEGGDQENPHKGKKDWKTTSNGTAPPPYRWRPDHDKGASVVKFTVMVAGFDPDHCPQSTLPGDDVDIEYTPSVGAPTHLHVVHAPDPSGKKDEPQVVSPTDLPIVTPTPATTTTTTVTSGLPQQLVYDQGNKGWISNVTVGGVSCGFHQPDTDNLRTAVRITIFPERK